MRRRSRRRSIRSSTLLVGLLTIVCAASVVQLLYAVGIGPALDGAVRRMAENEVITSAVLEAELGRSYTIQQLANEEILSQSALLIAGTGVADEINLPDTQAVEASQAPVAEADEPVQALALSLSAGESPLPDTPYYEFIGDTVLTDEPENEPENESGQKGDDQAADEPEVFYTQGTVFTGADADSIVIRNETSYIPQVYDLLQEPVNITISPDEPSVLIIHTHATESYTAQGGEDEGVYRTTDIDNNIVRVGTEIADTLTENGINVIHDTGIYDSPSYSGSYTRTLKVIEQYLEEYPSITAVLDVHRDSGVDSEGNVTKTTAIINGQTCSQVMLVVGTDEGGLSHPGFMENVKFSLRLQAIMNREYPGLARPLNLRQERFNQHLTSGSLIAEIGFSGNTLDEALSAARYFAKAYAAALDSLTG